MEKRRLVVVGAGPIGLECALRGVECGFEVTVFERGRVGEAIRRWQHVRWFTPFRMNSSTQGRAAVASMPNADELLTGGAFCREYLEPLARSAALVGRIQQNHEVVAVSRATYGKSDRIGRADRGEQPFRILTKTPNGEQLFEADVLTDCTGFTSKHRAVGAGGIPCPGESRLPEEAYRIPDALGDERNAFADKHTLIIGSGYSAATSVVELAQLAAEHPNTKLTWLTRGGRETPISIIPEDPLPERVRLSQVANARALHVGNCVTWLPGPLIEKIVTLPNGFDVQLLWPGPKKYDEGHEDRAQSIRVDRIVANPGYRPNTDPFAELQIHRCYATEGPVKLAAHLLGNASGDCLQQTGGQFSLLQNPEPNFYILGAASYGRDSRFLLQAGLNQIEELFSQFTVTTGVLT